MSNLSRALQKLYTREGNKVVFCNGQSLNQLALAMWEKLGFQQVDASVLSRVIKGERLLTPGQLRALCELLALPSADVEPLLVCLQRDYNAKNNLDFDATYISPSLARDIIQELTKGAFEMFYHGNHSALEKRFALVRQLANMYLSDTERNLAIGESVGFNLYLKGRALTEDAVTAVENALPIYAELLSMGKTYGSTMLQGYAWVLMSAAHYAAGAGMDEAAKRRHYSASIDFAQKAIAILPEHDHERHFALRSMTASAYYLNDVEAIRFVFGKTR